MKPQKLRNEMKDYLVNTLRNFKEYSENKTIIKPKTKEIISGIKSNYILVGNQGLVMLVDKEYPNDALKQFHRKAKTRKKNLAYVLLKDGDTFFKAAAPKNHFKRSKRLSLKNYSTKQINRMITFRPEETFLYNIRNKILHYYQTNSPRLDQGIVTFKFAPVHYDYSHPTRNGYQPQNTNSKKRYIWTKRKEFNSSFKLGEKFLIRKKISN